MKTQSHNKRIIPFLVFSVLILFVPLQTTYAEFTKDIDNENHDTEKSVNENDPYESHFFRIRGIPTIHVKSINGNIDVISNPNIDGIQVDLYVERSFTLWSGPRSLDDFRIIIRQQGDRIIASVEERRAGSTRRRGDIRFHFVIQTPGNANTQIRTGNGDITLSNHEGEHFLQNQFGNIEVGNVSGMLQVSTITGGIYLDHINGTTFASSVNGDVEIVECTGEMRLKSVAGNISAFSSTGTLVAATTSGNITSDFRNISIGVYLESVSGNIDLILPDETSYRIEGSAMQFDFSGLKQDLITSMTRRNRDASLITGDGDIPVQLSTFAGRIKVSHSE